MNVPVIFSTYFHSDYLLFFLLICGNFLYLDINFESTIVNIFPFVA